MLAMEDILQLVRYYSVDPAIRDTTIKRTQVREIYSSFKRSGPLNVPRLTLWMRRARRLVRSLTFAQRRCASASASISPSSD